MGDEQRKGFSTLLFALVDMILGILSTFLSIPFSLIMYNVLLMIIVANQKKEKDGVGGPFVGKLIGSS